MRLHHLLLLVLVLSSCSGKKENFTITGTAEGLKDATIYLYQRSLSGTVPVDSSVIKANGGFALHGYTDQPNFYILFVNKDQYINLLIHPKDRFRITTKADNFNRNYFVEGSKDSRLILKLVTKQAETLDRITELSNAYEKSLDRPDLPKIKAHLDSIYDIVFNAHKQFSIAFIHENKTSLVSLMALYQQVGRQSPVFDYKKDFRYFAEVDSALFSLYPGSDAVKDLNKKVAQILELLKIEIGSPAPVLSLPDTSGKAVGLKDIGEHYILVNFWASWSDASMVENEALLKLYKKFHPKGFEVYQVSLDRTRESWIGAIQKNAAWIDVCDFGYWDSPAVGLYRVESLPSNCLINPAGKIIAMNCQIPELEKKLTEIYP
jgi:peroxiredoxin